MNFKILGFANEVPKTTTTTSTTTSRITTKTVPKTIIVTLKNEAKRRKPEAEGIYDLSPELKNEKPQWKIRGGGTYKIASYSDKWYIVTDDDQTGMFFTKDQKNFDLLPDDPTFKWHYWNRSTSSRGETNSGDFNIQGI